MLFRALLDVYSGCCTVAAQAYKERIEALAGILESNPRGVLIARDELAGWVRAMDQYKSGKGADRQNWLSLWSNAPISVDRKTNSEPVIVESPWVSVTGSIQPEILPDLSNGREDGLLDRFLFAYPEPYFTPLSAKEISATAENELRALYERLASLKMPESAGEHFPGTVPLAPGSWEAFKNLAEAGISEKTLKRAKAALGVGSSRAGSWCSLWSLPAEHTPSSEAKPDENLPATLPAASRGIAWLRQNPEAVAEAVRENRGLLSYAARQLGAHRNSFARLRDENDWVRDLVMEAQESLVDELEDVAFGRALRGGGSQQLLMFLLKTKGKARGYVEAAREREAASQKESHKQPQ